MGQPGDNRVSHDRVPVSCSVIFMEKFHHLSGHPVGMLSEAHQREGFGECLVLAVSVMALERLNYRGAGAEGVERLDQLMCHLEEIKTPEGRQRGSDDLSEEPLCFLIEGLLEICSEKFWM